MSTVRLGSLASVALSIASLAIAGCAHGAVISQSLADMDRARTAPAVLASSKIVPDLAAHAEEERAEAQAADARRDTASADLLAERARVAYEREVVVTRLTDATLANTTAKAELAKRQEEAQRLVAARLEFEKAAERTSTELAVLREAKGPARVGPADAERERARAVAARSLATEAHLLCAAARLVARDAAPEASAKLDAASHDADAVLTQLASPSQASPPSQAARAREVKEPIELAARARAACLDALTRLRRGGAAAGAGDSDALLAALSARGGWAPIRDERGVVVTFRGAFKGTALTPEADRDVRELGRVAAAHPSFAIQVVLHDATPPSAAEQALDLTRAKATVAALLGGGAAQGATSTEAVGNALPVTDPADATTRGRNARVDIVFVSPSD